MLLTKEQFTQLYNERSLSLFDQGLYLILHPEWDPDREEDTEREVYYD